MNFSDLVAPEKRNAPYTLQLTDIGGSTDYELSVSGSARVIKKVLADAEFDALIDADATEDVWESRYQKIWADKTGSDIDIAGPETIDALDKADDQDVTPTSKTSIVVSVRRTKGKGTFWWLWFGGVALPVGWSMFVVLPPICNCSGFVQPLAGDPDLFLSANAPFGPVLASSTRGVGFVDRVSFGPAICWPWQEFVPWFRVRAFSTCVTNVGVAGFGVIP